MQRPGSLITVHAGRENQGWEWEWGQQGPQRNPCQETAVIYHAVFGGEVEVLVVFRNPADGKFPKFFKASRMLACNGNTE